MLLFTYLSFIYFFLTKNKQTNKQKQKQGDNARMSLASNQTKEKKWRNTYILFLTDEQVIPCFATLDLEKLFELEHLTRATAPPFGPFMEDGPAYTIPSPY